MVRDSQNSEIGIENSGKGWIRTRQKEDMNYDRAR